MLALPESLITETKLGSRQHQSWALFNSKDRQDFIKKVSQLMQTANKLVGNDAKCKRNDDETRSERTRKQVHMDTACKFDNRTEKQHLPTYTHTKSTGSSTSHNLSWSSPGWNDVGRLHQ